MHRLFLLFGTPVKLLGDTVDATFVGTVLILSACGGPQPWEHASMSCGTTQYLGRPMT